MSSIGIGLFGTGVAADNHAYAIARSDKFSIVAVADDKYQLAHGFSKRHHIDRCYGDLEYLLEDEGVDIVLLSSPFPCISTGLRSACFVSLFINKRRKVEKYKRVLAFLVFSFSP